MILIIFFSILLNVLYVAHHVIYASLFNHVSNLLYCIENASVTDGKAQNIPDVSNH